ncbi:DinB family protein [Ferruginibacter albus]|uniref:DinB family protein n=1 Tax=Ferruginibacter albus TaxID=2875540 RepID=UPI001CC33C6E|nr:DinB family protein [Ferruginibacter albus]UAY53009.1 DinB family protein [Ferruginibacter albus]
MEKQFDVIAKTRTNFLKLIDDLTIEQLNKIPVGFNNNIAWNFGHIIISQQVLCYSRAGFAAHIEQSLINKYQRGSKPESFIDNNEIELLKEYLFSLIHQLREDMTDDKFVGYKPITTTFGVDLTCIEDVIPYFAMHDGLHLGVAQTLKKLVQ